MASRIARLQRFSAALTLWLKLMLCLACISADAQELVLPRTNAARPQASAPYGKNFGDTSGIHRETRHRDALGNICLSVEPLARAHVTNPSVYDHLLIMRNQCPRSIRTRACYTESDDCVDAEVPGNARTEVILGISPMIKTFTYDIREF